MFSVRIIVNTTRARELQSLSYSADTGPSLHNPQSVGFNLMIQVVFQMVFKVSGAFVSITYSEFQVSDTPLIKIIIPWIPSNPLTAHLRSVPSGPGHLWLRERSCITIISMPLILYTPAHPLSLLCSKESNQVALEN